MCEGRGHLRVHPPSGKRSRPHNNSRPLPVRTGGGGAQSGAPLALWRPPLAGARPPRCLMGTRVLAAAVSRAAARLRPARTTTPSVPCGAAGRGCYGDGRLTARSRLFPPFLRALRRPVRAGTEGSAPPGLRCSTRCVLRVEPPWLSLAAACGSPQSSAATGGLGQSVRC